MRYRGIGQYRSMVGLGIAGMVVKFFNEWNFYENSIIVTSCVSKMFSKQPVDREPFFFFFIQNG